MTRIKAEVDELWQEVLLGDEEYFQLATGGTPSTERKEYWENGTIPWLSSGEVHKKVIYEADGRITEQGYRNSNARFYPVNSILIALAGQGKTRGTTAITETEVSSNQSIAAIIPNQELIVPYYAYYYLDSLYEDLRSISAGAGRAGLSLSILAKVAIKIPEKPMQASIAAILRSIDKEIDRTEKLIEKQQRIKRGLLQDLLTKGIDENGTIRSEAMHEFKDSPLGRIPVEWQVKLYGEICSRVSVGIATSTTKYFCDDGIPLLRNQNIKEDGIDVDNLLYISKAFDERNKNKRLKAEDIVTARTGYPGLSAVASEAMEGWQTFTTLISSPIQEKVNSEFMSLLINSDICKTQILNLQAGGAQQNLNVGWFVNMTVLCPGKAEQEGIVQLISAAESLISSEVNKSVKLKKLKQGLMQDLLTGKVRVNSE